MLKREFKEDIVDCANFYWNWLPAYKNMLCFKRDGEVEFKFNDLTIVVLVIEGQKFIDSIKDNNEIN